MLLSNMKKSIAILWLLFGVLLLSSCGFHPRRASEIPPQLHTLYIETQQPYNPLITQLKDMLRSLDVNIVKKPAQAAYTLHIDKIAFSQSNPPITTTRLAVSFTYSLSVSVQISISKGKDVTRKKVLSATRSISQNASQVYTPGTATLARHELRRDIISQIYYLLISNDTRNALSHHVHKST